jgi:heme/copper-type cytochrome/quinol oxidase subunit 3
MAIATAPPASAPTPALPPAPADVQPELSRRGASLLGASMAVAASVMATAALVAACLAIDAAPGPWRPKGVDLSTYLPNMIVLTAVMSSVSAGWTLWAVRRDDRRSAVMAAVLTLFLAVAVANGQSYLMTHAGLRIGANAFSTLFVVFTGFHLLHAIAGVVLLAVVLGRTLANQFSADDHDAVTATTVFWNWANLVWVAAYAMFYVMGK